MQCPGRKENAKLGLEDRIDSALASFTGVAKSEQKFPELSGTHEHRAIIVAEAVRVASPFGRTRA